jgi:hypothetical protein
MKRKVKMEQETYQASESMKRFFTKLLYLKDFVSRELKESQDNVVLKEIMERLDDCIKESK